MRAVVQRVSGARVLVDGTVSGSIEGSGLVVLLGVRHDDTEEQAAALARRIWELRILEGERSASDVHAPVLVVSQFTLYADLRKGRRPSWNQAAPRHVSEPLYVAFCDALRSFGADVTTGSFGAHMQVELTNEGPVTILVEI